MTIRYMAWGNADILAMEQGVIDRFEKKHPDIRVKLFMVPDSIYHQKMQIMLASRCAPDVMKVEGYKFPAFVRKDYFRPIDDFVKNDPTLNLDDYYEEPVKECMYNGKLYGLNIAWGGQVLYFNKTMFKKAGLLDPYELDKRGEWTWDKYLEVAQKLTKKGKNGKYIQFGTTFPHHWTIVWAFGGDYISPDFKRCVLDTPEAIRGLQFLQDLRWKYHVTPTAAEGTMSAFTFESGRMGMYFGWSGQTPVILSRAKGFEWDIAPMPVGPYGRVTPMKGNTLTVYKESRHPKEAYEFIKYMTSAENEMWICGVKRRWITTHKSVAANPEYLKAHTPPYNTDVFLHEMEYGRRPPINEKYDLWAPELSTGLSNLTSGEMSAKEMVKWLVPRINRALQENEW